MDRPRWTPRVPQHKVRRLYLDDAAGVHDDQLVLDVGERLYARCLDIELVTDAKYGRIHCPRCDTIVTKQEVLECSCGWRLEHADYVKTYRYLELAGDPEFIDEFKASWIAAKTTRARWLAIDRLLHRWHWQHKQDEHMVGRPMGVNFIEGNRKQVIALLDELSDLPGSGPEVEESARSWHEYKKITEGGRVARNADRR
jgi:hypothetical protein